MEILQEIRNKVMANIYRKMLHNLKYHFEFKRGKKYHDRYAYLVFLLGNTRVESINVTKQAHWLAK